MLVEALWALLISWMYLRAVAMGEPPARQMLIAAMGSAGYAVSSAVAGRWVTVRSAPWLLVSMILAAVAIGLGAIAIDRFAAFVLFAGLIGVCIGHYYVPFQVNMGHVRPFRTTAWSVAAYNVAWGGGAAIGPFLAAWFKQQPVGIIAGIAIGLAAAHTVVWLIAQFAPRTDHGDQPHAAFASTRRQRVASRWAFFTVGLVIRGLYATLWPYVCEARGWSDQVLAMGLFAMFAMVPVWGMVLARLRRRLRGPGWMIAGVLIGAAAFGLMPAADRPWLALLAVMGVGTAEAITVFHALYYANVDAEQPTRSIGWVETIAGGAFVVGPICFGLLAWNTAGALAWRTYLPGSALLVATAIGLIATARRDPSRR